VQSQPKGQPPKIFPRLQVPTTSEACRPAAPPRILPANIETTRDVQATPMPNLWESLGHSSVPAANATSPTPPMTPVTPGYEELFFGGPRVEGMPLGSPSDPSVVPRKTVVPKHAAVRPKATPFIPVDLEGGASEKTIDDYFSIPLAERRLSRRRSSASGSSRSDQEEWTIVKTDLGNGGLKNAVEASDDPSEKVYVGTLGFGTDGLDESTKVAIEGTLRDRHECLVAYTSDADFDGHYNHYCKEVRLSTAWRPATHG